ncbi:MAG: hypothetical protein KatS3mg125_0257 [Lysobacterales bacterium]|jgi:hypothetical protein|nr:MAG: hypothetical protein KatS3mg125_0257 [Xanthomonadales bacterium]
MSLILKVLVLLVVTILVAGIVAVLLMVHRPRRIRARAGLGATDSLKWREFVRLTSDLLARRGFRPIEEEHALNPRGYDLAFQRGSKRYLVQFKQGRATKVNPESLKALRQAMAEQDAAGGIVISTGQIDRHVGVLDPTIEILHGEALWNELEPLLEGKLKETAESAIRHSFQLRIGTAVLAGLIAASLTAMQLPETLSPPPAPESPAQPVAAPRERPAAPAPPTPTEARPLSEEERNQRRVALANEVARLPNVSSAYWPTSTTLEVSVTYQDPRQRPEVTAKICERVLQYHELRFTRIQIVEPGNRSHWWQCQ